MLQPLPTRSPTHHGEEGALLEAGVEGDELGLRVLLAPQESAARGGRDEVSSPAGPQRKGLEGHRAKMGAI